MTADVLDDGIVHLIAADPDGTVHNNAAQGDHSHFRRAAADIHNHVARWFLHRQADTNGRRHGFFHHPGILGSRRDGCVNHRPLLHFCDSGRDCYDNPRPHPAHSPVCPVEKVPEHPLGGVEIGDHSIPQRPDGNDIPRRASYHFLGFVADSQDVLGFLVPGHHRWFVDHNAASPHINQCVGSSQIDADISS